MGNKQTLLIAGVWTSVCVAFSALQAKADGFNVYFVIDASGDPTPMASQTTAARLAQAGIIRPRGVGQVSSAGKDKKYVSYERKSVIAQRK